MCVARVVLFVIVLATVPLVATPSPSTADTLAVSIHLEFDDSISSNMLKAMVRDEAAAIWKVYGVDLQWTDRGCRPALALYAIVERDRRYADFDGAPLVLGHTTIASDAIAQAPIRISFDAVNSLLDRQRADTMLLRERKIATALGRVLAHEVGHVLLGVPAYHDPVGLMQNVFYAGDLAWAPRSRYQLMDRSVTRLRARMSLLANQQLP